MKTPVKITLLIIALVIFTGVFLCFDFNDYSYNSKTVSLDDNGLILSITTFDGKNESQPFVPCLGHTWLSLDNQTDHSVYVKGCEIKPNELLTFSVWGISNHFGIAFNLEPDFIKKNGRYNGRKSISVNIEESSLKLIDDFMNDNDTWTFYRNCSCWSIKLWNKLVPEESRVKSQILLYTPEKLVKSLNEHTTVQTDMDFSRAGSAFFFEDGKLINLELCDEK